MLVAAPTQTGKTTGLAVPAVLEWDGPALVCSIKTDLLRDTITRRQALGDVQVFDPTGVTDVPDPASWSPLGACETWRGAQRIASWLIDAAPIGQTVESADFWQSAAELLLAPILFAAAANHHSMATAITWIQARDQHAITAALQIAGVAAAHQAAHASFTRDSKQLSSIYTTVETALKAYGDPGVLASTINPQLTPHWLLEPPDDQRRTLYLCAPEHEQRRLRPIFVALIKQIVTAVYERAAHAGQPIDPPLLLCLDEAANIAPLPDLDTIAATAAGQGIQLLSIFQDLAQIKARWGDRAPTILSSHRARLFGPGIADPDTLQTLTQLLGDRQTLQHNRSTGGDGRDTTSQTTTYRPLASRCLAGGDVGPERPLELGPPHRVARRPGT